MNSRFKDMNSNLGKIFASCRPGTSGWWCSVGRGSRRAVDCDRRQACRTVGIGCRVQSRWRQAVAEQRGSNVARLLSVLGLPAGVPGRQSPAVAVCPARSRPDEPAGVFRAAARPRGARRVSMQPGAVRE